uniref:CHAT domain-containing protein n=1 Tax=Grammatophora oceanica TaxID=210454 RepID=A0A7S1UPK7_9STRA|mmetsp:Transcript_15570/g.22889  ORF Transcript_15570/g.22889 Transcript_15570/m.22889 type:complete len:721 (+) Transcript_15570:1169-3331(+)
MTKQSWRSPLHTLNLASNNLATGGLVLEIIALLKNNALALRSLDLSDNGLVNDGYQFTPEVLCGSIAKNSCLRELDLSGNSFNFQFVDGLLFHLGQREAETGLSSLKLDRNVPELSESQKLDLERVLKRSRKVAFERFLSDQERIKSGKVLDDPVIAERNPSLTDAGLRERLSALDSEDTFDLDQELGRKYSPTEKGGNMITVLFSAPLVFHDESRRLRPFAKLDFAMERDLIWHCLKEASRDIELSFDTATHHRLLATMTKRSSCLHYSGHGHPSYLPFENGKGGPHWLQVNELREMVSQEGGAPFKMVFVSACHSGLAGETFASAGVPHVVCCQQESELKDTAALAFTRQFYLALTVGHTVKEAFEQGCKAVRATPNLRNPEIEMKKFVLLPRDGNHDVPVFNAKPLREWPNMGSSRILQASSRPRRGRSLMRSRSLYFGGARSSELSVRNMMQEDPSPTPPQDFMGREVDMFKVLGSILTKRLVSVVGEPGVGRSSLVCSLCHYVNERSSTIMEIDQIFYVKTKQARGDRCQKLIKSLLDKLVEAGKANPPDDGMDLEDLFEAVCNSLKNTKALIVFDRTELLEGEDEAQDFPMFLSNLFRETRNVRVVLTSRQPLGIPSLGGVVEQPHYLRPLDFANTVRLFAKLSPELHTPKARQDFFSRVVAGDSSQADLCISDQGINDRTRSIFAKFGNGMPDGVEKAAYTLRDEVATLGLDS